MPPPLPAAPINSTLRARALPTVPKAEQTYESLVRNVLRQRLLRQIFPYSALAVWVFESFWIYLNLSNSRSTSLFGILVLPLRPSALLASFLTWTFVVLPLIIARRDNLTGECAVPSSFVFDMTEFASATPTPAASPSQQLKAAFSKRATRTCLVVYIFISLSFFMIQLSVARMCRSIEDLHLNVFVKSKCAIILLSKVLCV
jgi:nucleoporin NDC1